MVVQQYPVVVAIAGTMGIHGTSLNGTRAILVQFKEGILVLPALQVDVGMDLKQHRRATSQVTSWSQADWVQGCDENSVFLEAEGCKPPTIW